MQAALNNVDGVAKADVKMPDSAEITGTASAEALIAAIKGIPGEKYSASAQ